MEIKKRILDTLKEGKLSTSRVAGILGIDYHYTIRLLDELLSEGKVEKIEETIATYWRLLENE